MQITDIQKAKTQFSRLISLALAGEEVQIGRDGKPLVRLVPIVPDSLPRQGGQLTGKIWIADNFDSSDSEIEKRFDGEES